MSKSNYVTNYIATLTFQKFHADHSYLRAVMGPVGSGKTAGCCMEVFLRAQNQLVGPDGYRRSRWFIVRNTLPQLETTTLNTWKDWFPEHIFGRISRKPPYTQFLNFNDVKLEVVFLALDGPEDVKKLLSAEVTGIFFNEAREIDLEILNAATTRTGRYPAAKDGGTNWHGIIMDTNPPDDRHWWYKFAEIDTPKGWSFYKQPSGMAANAENLENLLQTAQTMEKPMPDRRVIGRRYYEQMLGGKTQEWINVYVHGNYGFVKAGINVYNDAYNDDIHCVKQPIKINPFKPIVCGIDCSGRNPAAVFLQRSDRGHIYVVDEFRAEKTGAEQFSKMLRSEINTKFSGMTMEFWGDPAGGWKQQNDERTYFDILMKENIRVRPSPGLRFRARREVMLSVLGRMIDGKPLLQLSPVCKLTRRGFNGGYIFKNETNDDVEKNEYSHIHDALQYALCGLGEYAATIKGKRTTGTVTMKDWDVF